MSKSTVKSKQTNWAFFDKKEKSHMNILSQLRQLGWTKPHDKYGEVADLNRFSDWLKSDKSPVRKPLMDMSKPEISKIICALDSIIGKEF